MDLRTKIHYHKTENKYCTVKRQVGLDTTMNTAGFIVDFSESFILMNVVIDFTLDGYQLFPMHTIIEIRCNNNDKYYGKILKWEGICVENKYAIDLTNWNSVFKSIRKTRLNIIVENEDPEDKTFDIGPITKITKSAVYIRYFNAKGILNIEASKIEWKYITVVHFDDKYTNTFSKYLREQKIKVNK
jgi:hypothetical protein